MKQQTLSLLIIVIVILGNSEKRIKKRGGKLYIYANMEFKKIYQDQKIIFILIFNHQFVIKSLLLLPN